MSPEWRGPLAIDHAAIAVAIDLKPVRGALAGRVGAAHTHATRGGARREVWWVCRSPARGGGRFAVTTRPIEPIWVMASGSGSDIPNWDIRDEFPNEGTMLVVNDATGRSLAKTLGAGRVCLLRGHGA